MFFFQQTKHISMIFHLMHVHVQQKSQKNGRKIPLRISHRLLHVQWRLEFSYMIWIWSSQRNGFNQRRSYSAIQNQFWHKKCPNYSNNDSNIKFQIVICSLFCAIVLFQIQQLKLKCCFSLSNISMPFGNVSICVRNSFLQTGILLFCFE